MKKPRNTGSFRILCLLAIACLFSFQSNLFAQDRNITVYQYRHVPADKIDEFVKRETTYWSKVAEKAVQSKKMTFWALFEKMGGYDLPNSSNFLFINTFPVIDSIGGVFSDVEATAGVKWADMETGSMSTVTSEFFLHEEGWAESAKAVPEKDFNFVEFVYHNTDFQDSLINLEKKYWAPFIKKTMDAGQTQQVAWGNARVLSPFGENIKFTTVSYDLFKSMQDALMPVLDPKIVFPTKGLAMIDKIEKSPRGRIIYRVVKVVSAPN